MVRLNSGRGYFAGVVLAPLAAAVVYLGLWRGDLMAAGAAEPAGCESAQAREFDFWVGSWRVTEGGELAGHNHIRKIDGGCALLESWTDASGSTGHSLNIYDARRGVWHQTWVDARGALLVLEGSFKAGAMVLEGERLAASGGQRTKDRITWTALAGGTVRQHWQTSADNGATWKTSFDGLYSPAPASERTE